jgi:hypothetical protein
LDKALRILLFLPQLRGRSIGSNPLWTGSPRVSFEVHIQNTEGKNIVLQITAVVTEEILISEVDDLKALPFPMNWKITGIPNASVVERGSARTRHFRISRLLQIKSKPLS